MIILGLGSNLSSNFGDCYKNIDLAILYLQKYKINLIKRSSFYKTPSYPNNKNPKFINTIIEVSSHLKPDDLAQTLLLIEEKLGRKRKQKNEPRTCDIDIIDFNGKIMNFNYNNLLFKVPHEKLIYRNFVLFPLQEILPNWKHPKTKEDINSLIEKLSTQEKNSILKVKKP